ncbi:SH3 domain-binding protein 2-like isoform X2 [Mya arenaria]|uniref:SH3 domain-binding protein 2-like isoform X2 n=1 Tax=Mya arenaria TaxID=6604 RepID=UPI0022E4E9CD|nr:SH3 domain-binding protein 2-like isoform X2 [Mya arenaria]
MAGKARQIPLKNIGAQPLIALVRKCSHEKLRKRDKLRSFLHLKWPHKFVVLAESCLYIYGDEASAKYEAAFSMADFKCVSVHTKGDQYFYLTFNDPEREHIVFCCDTKKSRKKWMKKLKEAIDEATDSGIGHEEDADQSDDEDSDDEEDNPSGMAAAKRPNTYIQINDNDIVSIAGDCTMLEGKLAEEPPYVNTSDHAAIQDEPTTPRDKPRSTVVTPLAKPVTTRDQPRSAVPLTHAEPVTTRDQPRSAVPLTHAEPVTTRDQPRSAVPLTHAEPVTRRNKPRSAVVLQHHNTPAGKPNNKQPLGTNEITGNRDDEDKHSKLIPTENRNSSSSSSSSDSENAFLIVSGGEGPLVKTGRKGGRPKTEVKMDDNTKNPINTKSSATSEPNSENAMSSVSSRGNNNSKAVKNKGASRSKQMQVNVLEQSIKPSTALGKGPARSYSSPKLQGSVQRTFPVVQEARASVQEEPLYENYQENLYENLRESDQMETDTTK